MSKVSIQKLRDQADHLRTEVETERDALQERFDDLSETAQEGPRGEKLQEQITALDEAIDALDTAMSSLEEAAT